MRLLQSQIGIGAALVALYGAGVFSTWWAPLLGWGVCNTLYGLFGDEP